jgi:hypothetical protein
MVAMDFAPMFFRAADDQLAYLNGEPDRWRDAREQALGTWLNATSKEHYVFLDLVPPEALPAPDRYAYLDIRFESDSVQSHVQL